MKKILLFAAAAVIAVTATAQFAKKATAVKAGQQKALPAATQKKFEVAGQKSLPEQERKTARMSGNASLSFASQHKADIAQKKYTIKSVKSAFNGIAAPMMQMSAEKLIIASAKAGVAKKLAAKAPSAMLQEYTGHCDVYSGGSWGTTAPWTMTTISAGGSDYMFDVIPDLAGFSEISAYANGVFVEYTSTDNGDGTTAITVAPQYIASSSSYDIFLCDYTSTTKGGDGSILMTLDADGNLTVNAPNNVIGYLVTPRNTDIADDELPPFVPANIAGAYEQCGGLTYTIPVPDTFVAETVYTGTGSDFATSEYVTWQMQIGKKDDVNIIRDLVPSVSGYTGIPTDVEYTVEGNKMTIQPQLVGNFGEYYLYIFDWDSEDGSITLIKDENGNLTTTAEMIFIGAFTQNAFDPEKTSTKNGGTYAGLLTRTDNAMYYAEGQEIPTPVSFVAETVYTGKGYDKGEAANVTWQMQIGKKDDVNVIRDLVPSISEDTGIPTDVEYTIAGNKISIQPQKVGKYEAYYLYLFDWDSEDGTITLTKDDQGHITTPENLNLVIGAFATDAYTSDYSSDDYAGYFTRTEGVVYYAEDQEIPNGAPNVEYQPNNLTLFAGLGVSGYSYNNNLVMIGAYGPLNFRNSTVDDATAWNWSVTELDYEEDKEITATTKDFTLNTTGGAVYTNFALVGINEEEKSDSVKWGVGKALATDGSVQYTDLYAYAGRYASSFTFSDGTTATMTTQDPDGDLTFYTNWATPEKASNSMSKIYVYQGKPSTPIYFEGVTLPVINFADNGDFNLHVAIRKCERDPKSGKIAMGDIVAEADATIENVDDSHAATSGLTAINFTNFYVEDEWGMSEEVEYLFMDEEFLIEIDNWDNGTFTAVLGSQDITPANALNTTFFEMSGEEGSVYSYTSWKTSLFVGLIEPAYGYLYTTDNTDLNLSVDGEAATIHVTPMLNSIDENANPTYRLFIKDITVDGEEAAEVPEWLTFSVANEDYDEEGEHYAEYDLNVMAEALPVGVQGRKAEVTFFQEGAMLKVSVQQGEVIDGISQTVTGKVNNDGKLYDLSGRQVQAGKKGLVIMNGKKFIVK